MIRANKNDRKLMVDLLAKAFEGNYSVNYLVRQDKNKIERIRRLMEYSIEMCYLFGELWLSDDKKGVALVLFPHKKKITFRTIYLDLILIFKCIGISSVFKAMMRERLIKAKQPRGRMTYIWFIGVDYQHQRTGIGSRLLNEVILRSQSNGLPVFLETSTVLNLPWYKRAGFEIYDELNLMINTLYFFKRDLS
jgi:GNAT superfamily N-acetyltransferase